MKNRVLSLLSSNVDILPLTISTNLEICFLSNLYLSILITKRPTLFALNFTRTDFSSMSTANIKLPCCVLGCVINITKIELLRIGKSFANSEILVLSYLEKKKEIITTL